MSNAYHGQRPPRPAPAPQKPTPAQAYLTAYGDARATAFSGKSLGRGALQASMRAQLERDGLKPVTDPGADLPPAQADMRRRLARLGEV